MRFSRPTTGTVLGAIALFVALGGTALAAGATVVNIADPTKPANVAHVDGSGRLQVNGAAAITNTVSTQLAPPSAYIHTFFGGLDATRGCVVLATPPANKAMIVREVRVDVYDDPTPGSGQAIHIFAGTTCGLQVADVNPATVGSTVLPFDPGLGIAAGSGLSVLVSGAPSAEVYTDGYSVPASSVPSTPAVARNPSPQQQH